jgi:hypothetical protein
VLKDRLEKIKELLKKREEGKNMINMNVKCGEKVIRKKR